MKTKNVTTIFGLFFLLIQVSFGSNGPADFSQSYQKKFSINKDATLKINTEFTDIKAYNWDKNEISVEVNVSVDSKNEAAAMKKISKVEVELLGSSSLVELTTGLSSSFNSNNDNLDIEMIIYYPASVSLEMDCEFGNAIMEDFDGNVDIEMSYGNFEGRNLNHTNANLEAEFGKIRLQKFQSGKVEVSYGEFISQYAGVLKLDSEFSNVEIEEMEQLELETAYDKIYVGQLNHAFVSSEFSSLRIDELKKSLQLDIAYGSFNLKSIASDFEKIHIESQFTGINLSFKSPLNFAFDVKTDMGNFSYPKELAKVSFLEKEMMSMRMKGYFGQAKSEDAKLILNLENANASVKVVE